MSIAALLQGCKSRLVTDLGAAWATSNMLDIEMPPGKPPPLSGNKFIALWANEWRPGLLYQEEGIDEYYFVTATITLRTGTIPDDRMAQKAFLEVLEPLARQIIVSMVKNRWAVLQSANALILGANNIVEPLRWLGADAQATPRGPDWFTAEPPPADSTTSVRDYGLSMDIRFGEARRLQTFANME